MFGSSLPSLWSSATKVYSGQGADIVMQSLEIHVDAYGVSQALRKDEAIEAGTTVHAFRVSKALETRPLIHMRLIVLRSLPTFDCSSTLKK